MNLDIDINLGPKFDMLIHYQCLSIVMDQKYRSKLKLVTVILNFNKEFHS